MRPVTVPASTAKITVPADDLAALPSGAVFREKNGAATTTVIATSSGYEITASCDSLQLLVTEIRTEAYHLKSLNTALKHDLNTKQVVELSGWQWFQIWLGRILSSAGALLLIWRFYIGPRLGAIKKFLKI